MLIDVRTRKKQKWFDDYKYIVNKGKYGNYYTFKITDEELKQIVKKIKKLHCKYIIYEECWNRNASYRNKFFKHYSPPYICRYCGKYLKKEYAVVDHVVPVAKTKYSKRARNLLQKRGIYNVNDERNLVPSCRKCNNKKSDKMGMWYLRGKYGNHKWFKIAYRIYKIFFLIILSYLLYVVYSYLLDEISMV